MHPRHTSSSALVFPLRTRQLSASMRPNNRFLADRYLGVPASMYSLSGLCTPWFASRFHNFRFSFSSSTSSPGKIDISRPKTASKCLPNTILTAPAQSARLWKNLKYRQIYRAPGICGGRAQLFFQRYTLSTYLSYFFSQRLQIVLISGPWKKESTLGKSCNHATYPAKAPYIFCSEITRGIVFRYHDHWQLCQQRRELQLQNLVAVAHTIPTICHLLR